MFDIEDTKKMSVLNSDNAIHAGIEVIISSKRDPQRRERDFHFPDRKSYSIYSSYAPSVKNQAVSNLEPSIAAPRKCNSRNEM